VEADDPEGLEKLCRYILRPPIANSRLTWMGNDKVALTLKRPWSDGTTQLVFTPLEFVQRLIPLIPMPGTNRLRFHGAFAPNSPYRSRVVPRPCSDEAPSRDHVQTDVGEAGASNKGGHKADEHQSTSPSAHSDCRHQSPASKSKSLGWAKCMARVFDLDVLTCPKCKGDMQIISFITDTPVIKKILNSVGPRVSAGLADRVTGQKSALRVLSTGKMFGGGSIDPAKTSFRARWPQQDSWLVATGAKPVDTLNRTANRSPCKGPDAIRV